MDFDVWLNEQSEDVQGMIAKQTAGLSSALESERGLRRQLAKDLKTAVKNSGADSGMRSQLEKMTADLSMATSRADFFAQGHTAGIANLPLGYLAAKESGLIGEDGGADFEQMKAVYPELFGSAAPETIVLGNGGNGRDGGSSAESGTTMDELLRK